MRRLGWLVGAAMVSVLILGAAAPKKPAERPLRDVLKEYADLQAKMEKLEPELSRRFERFLPGKDSAYGTYTWDCRFGGGFFVVQMLDEEEMQLVWVHGFYRPDLTKPERESFDTTCHGLPAKRFKDRWCWVLVGNIELRVCAGDPKFESDQALDAVIGAFDLEGLKKL